MLLGYKKRRCEACKRKNKRRYEARYRKGGRASDGKLPRLPVAPIAAAYMRSHRLPAEVACNAGILTAQGNGNVTGLMRVLGLWATKNGSGVVSKQTTIDHDLGVAIIHALGLDPVDVGV